MKIFNTLTREKQELVPVEEGKLKIYACGPTVYNYIHIGNARPLCVFDVLRRYLEWRGLDVRFVQNFTDIDDKLIKKANEEGITVPEVAARYIEEFWTDSNGLNIRKATVHPKATENIDAIIGIITELVEKGYAYPSAGDVYFRAKKFDEYGKLSHQPLDELAEGASNRVDGGADVKEDPMDFCLWKGAKEGEPFWESPWGKGRPGWHIECSAMAMKYLGETFDLHTGGIDNLFPHHENEIAQAEAATGCEFVKTWMHCAHLRVNGEKMSKSLGNFFTLRDLIEKGWSGREIRYVLINAHYRQGLNFAFSALEDARKSLERIDRAVDALAKRIVEGEAVPEFATKALEDFTNAVNDDLNIPMAFAALFELVRQTNASGTCSQGVLDVFRRMDEVLGVIFFGKKEAEEIPGDIAELLERRAAARAARDWAQSDLLRDEIAAKGWQVKDSKEGQSCTKM
jgi:cysteinyl-tRNA synthetase